MDIPARMIGVVTVFLWMFLIVFTISAVYSIKDLQLSFGKPQTNVTAKDALLLSLPINVTNRGFYNVGSFNVTTLLSDLNESTIAQTSTFKPVIVKGETATILHNMTLSISHLLESSQGYLFNDTQLNVTASVSLRIAEVIPIQASADFSIPWGAPLWNFMLGSPTFEMFNLTHLRVMVPMSFENHAFFDIAGSVQMRMYNNAGLQAGDGQASIEAPQHSLCKENVEFYVPALSVTSTGHFEVYFVMSVFDFGSWVIPYDW